jgi:hypothetical protein
MNENSGGHERSTLDLILFGIIFCGVGLEAVGAVTASRPAAITGFILIGLGLSYFCLAGADGD